MASEWAVVAAAAVGGLAGAGIPALVGLHQTRFQAGAAKSATQAQLLGRIAEHAAAYQGSSEGKHALTACLMELSVTGTSKQIRGIARQWLDDLRGNSAVHADKGIERLAELSEAVE